MSAWKYATQEYIDRQEAQLAADEIEKVKALATEMASVMGTCNREAYAALLSLIPPHRVDVSLVDTVNALYVAYLASGQRVSGVTGEPDPNFGAEYAQMWEDIERREVRESCASE